MSTMMRGNVRMVLSGVRAAKWRSVLTMLGVIVGVVAVVLVVGIGEGVKRQVAAQLTHFGKDLITVRPGRIGKTGTMGAATSDVLFGLGVPGLTVSDVETVQQTADVAQAAPLGLASGLVQATGHKPTNALLVATNANLPTILNQPVSQGGFWNADEETENVAVIGPKVAVSLFGEPVPLGQTFTFRGQTFMVRGVFASFKAVPFSPTASFDDAIFIPYQTAATLTHNNANVYVLLAKPDTRQHMDQAVANITSRLRSAHGGQQDFTVLSPKQTEALGSDTVQLLTEWITAVAAISLCIGGVGIMNIMLLSVTERMHEIGVRKALGATSRQVLAQFMLEATVLSTLGGVIGIVISLVAEALLYVYTDIKPVVSWHAVVIASAVSIVVGIVFGTAPALKAARKDPIEALRHE
ncbi:MAG TPA: ABC transporter permease [Candidatus Saccharimonadales bacterium]|nr:ABC transporter permease [Candidatus Saccharimonadales bacterium]